MCGKICSATNTPDLTTISVKFIKLWTFMCLLSNELLAPEGISCKDASNDHF